MKQIFFFVALAFLTRLPAPSWVSFTEESMSGASRYYPIVGGVVGGICALVFVIVSQIFPVVVSVLLTSTMGVYITGAFHEDGFADCCDGFGGGWEKLQILTIMKDSRVGTYAIVGLGLLMSIKIAAICSLPLNTIVPSLVLAHSFSRLVSVSIVYNYCYVQDDQLSKVKPLAKNISTKSLLFSVATIAPLMFLLSWLQAVILVIVLMVVRSIAGKYFVKRIGGYTGDCLGALQQMAEVAIYLVLLATIQ